MQLATDKLRVEQADGVGWVTINNPERRNAISLAMWQAIGQAFEALAADPEVRCAVIKGAGDKAFASGADISEFEAQRANAAAGDEYNRIAKACRRAMLAFEKPLIAMIRGFCMGGGLGIALSADIRVAAADAVFGIPAARLGVAYDFVDLQQLVWLVGPAKAKEILFTANRYDAGQALAMGLVNTVVSAAELSAAVQALVRRLTDNAPLTLKASKLTVDEVLKDAGARDMGRVAALAQACFDSADYREGRQAFMEKRRPRFRGR